MKIRHLLLFLLYFDFINAQKSFSINTLIDYLQETGYYDMIFLVKSIYGDDAAIEFCEDLIQNVDCELIVRVYMNCGKGRTPFPIFPNKPTNDDLLEMDLPENFLKLIVRLYNDADQETKKLIYIIASFYDILIKQMTEREILIFIKKIISKNYNYYIKTEIK